MWQYLKLPSARRSALALFALVATAAAMACSFLISDTLPTGYTCLPSEGGVCPPGQVCAANAVGGQYSCVPLCTANDCQPGYVCNSVGLCVPTTSDAATPADAPPDAVATNAPDGGTPGDSGPTCVGYACRCTTTTDCPSGLVCVDRTAATPDIWNAWIDAGPSGASDSAGGMCLAPCCTSGIDCNDYPGDVCFATGAGGNYCVPPGWLGDRGEVGTIAGGQPCGGDGGACRSGLCTAAGYCADTCCSDFSTTECAPGTACRFGAFPGPLDSFDKHEAARCVPTGGSVGNGNGVGCNTNADCRSNLCFIDGGFGGGGNGGQPQPQGQCRDACRNPDECAGTATGGGRNPNPQASCTYLAGVGGAASDLVAACMPLNQQGGAMRGDAGGGAACRTTNDCQRGYCVSSTCLAVCFANGSTDCLAQEHCRPQALTIAGATYSVLGCGM